MADGTISETWDQQSGPDIVGARLDIDLAALADNWRHLAKQSGPATCGAAVKADAYGLGIAPAGRALAAAGCETFFVSQAAEGLALRQAVGPDCTIYILNGPLESALPAYRQAHLSPVINDLGQLALWRDNAATIGTRAALHLDTGMQRLGLSNSDCATLQAEGFNAAEYGIGLVMSHLANADQPDPTDALAQNRLFEDQIDRLGRGALKQSLCNSAGVSHCRQHDELAHDITRPGIALYGVQPYRGANLKLKSTVKLSAQIVQIRAVPAGCPIGYGGAHKVTRDSVIATLPVGYGDGYIRALSHAGLVDIDGHVAPVVGRVSMDLISIDVTDVPPALVQQGSPVTLIGGKASLEILAHQAGTIPYELLTGLSHRIPRFYSA
ncbi:MAG: alanine racemase [Alphaproteobacteria bacterium]